MRRILIDTNIYSLAMKGDEDVVEVLRRVEKIGVSTISIGELLSGFKGGMREEKNRKELDIFLDASRVAVFSVEVETTEFYAAIVNALKSQGTPIPTNDVWLAAIAFQNGCKFFTKDKHFKNIPGLVQFN